MRSHARPVIVIPVHNRRAITLGALQFLRDDAVFAWATVLVVDDGSSDGTAQAIKKEFPDVQLLVGDGTWWWCGAIRRGMDWALRHDAQQVFWLNDDCRPPAGGLDEMRKTSDATGAIVWIDARSPDGWSYGGHRRTAWRIRRCTVDEERRGKIDTFSGNCVCLPRSWVDRVGLPHDHLFPHGIGDLDYGLRLHAAGAELRPVPGLIAQNLDPAQSSAESWLTTKRSMRAVWADFRSPRSFFFFPAWWQFARRHWGPVWGTVVFAAPYGRWCAIAALKALAPAVARRWAGRKRLNSPTDPAARRY